LFVGVSGAVGLGGVVVFVFGVFVLLLGFGGVGGVWRASCGVVLGVRCWVVWCLGRVLVFGVGGGCSCGGVRGRVRRGGGGCGGRGVGVGVVGGEGSIDSLPILS